jgi:hypothetical protein
MGGIFIRNHHHIMLTDSLIIIAAITAATLIWRTLKDDHPAFKHWVRDLPLVGKSLSCGFCMPMWTTFFAVCIYNPLESWTPMQGTIGGAFWPLILFFSGWFTIGAGVLLLRSLIIVLMEAGSVLKHQHEAGHGIARDSALHEER